MAVCWLTAAAADCRTRTLAYEKHPLAREFLSAFDVLSSRITAGIVSFMPLVVFCSMAKMMISMDIRDILNIFLWVPLIYLGNIYMILI